MAPRRRSTKRARKISNNKMKGGKNWCCNGEICKEQGWAPTCSLGNAKYVCDDNVTFDNVTKNCRQAVVSIAANGTGLALNEAYKNSGNAGNAFVNALPNPFYNGGKKSKRRKSKKNRCTNKRK